jgi:hypothetical protein
MIARFLSLLMTVSLAVVPWTSARAAVSAEVPTQAGEPVLQIAVQEGLPDGDAIAKNLREEGDAQLEIQRIDPIVDPNDPKRIDVSVGGDMYDYQVEITASRAGAPVGDPKSLACECSKSELIRLVLQELAVQARELDGAPTVASEPTPAPADPDPPPVVEPPPAQAQDAGHRGPLGGLGKAGLAVLAVGVAGVATGATLAVVGSRGDRLGNDPRSDEVTDLRPPSIAALGVGAVLLISGGVLLAVDRFRARRSNTVVLPSGGRGQAGVLLVTRF